MANLFWKQEKKTHNLLSKSFTCEDEFERVIFNTKELFEELTFLKRQATCGIGSGRPDILAIDNEGNICIIEMKNKIVDEKILAQVLNYAIWAQSNPDSLKNLWYELDEKPDIDIDWENYEVRIMIIAPEIDPATLKFIPKISYDIDLIEIKRWVHKKDSFLLVNYLKPGESKKTKPLKGTGVYDENFYKKKYNHTSVTQFIKYVNDTEKLLKKNGWNEFEKKFNSFYCGFKYGFFNVFTISWIGTKSFAFRFRMPEKEFKGIKGNKLKMDRYKFKRAEYKVIPGVTKVESFLPIIKKAIKVKTSLD